MMLRKVYQATGDFSWTYEMWVVFGTFIGPVWVFKTESEARGAYRLIGVEFSQTPNAGGDYEVIKK